MNWGRALVLQTDCFSYFLGTILIYNHILIYREKVQSMRTKDE
jgi:hypothetical protein